MKIFFSLVFVAFAFIVFGQHNPVKTEDKFKRVLQYVRLYYVDTVNEEKLTEIAIKKMLEDLDPHSVYLSADEIKAANEQLSGNFDGIGVQFQIIRDTINIVDVIAGGPSEAVGIRSGDKIVTIDSNVATGKTINNTFVMKNLRGIKGSKVVLGIFRSTEKEILEYSIIRDKIPIYSVDASYMLTNKIGYIKINRFADKTMSEFFDAFAELKKHKMESLILDLRDNGGGYLKAAVDLASQFLPKNQLIVYTDGVNEKRYDYNSSPKGVFRQGKLVVLINQSSASASEIVSGAIQDCDRGLIIGRRSFGKGLVQRPFTLTDGSVIRLTVSRYHTPSGRCIQRSYSDGVEAYYKELGRRMESGEFVHPDTIKFPDSLRYKTISGRTVYGGGGIMPDVFVPIDTTRNSDYYRKLFRKNIFSTFVIDYLNIHRAEMLDKYGNIEEFKSVFKIDRSLKNIFVETASNNGIEYKDDEYVESAVFIETVLRAQIARGLYGNAAFYRIISEIDDELKKAVECIESPKIFKEHSISYK